MISVIVPVYNAEKTLPACVQSILDQSYIDFELILIDDGSKDSSGRICDELREKCLAQGHSCQVIHQENHGVSAARNRGMEQARGKYFVFIDSDDLVEPCYLEDLVRTAEDHPALGHVLCGFKCTSHVHDYVLSKSEMLSIVDRKDYMRLHDAILVQGPVLALYQTEIVRKNSIKMREDLSLAEDTLFNLDYLDALERTTIGIINKANYIYQDEDQNSLYHRYRPDMLAVHEQVNEEIKSALERWDVSENSWKRYYDSVYFSYLGILKNTFHPQNTMSARKKREYNSQILKRDGFLEALQKTTVRIPPQMQRACRSGDYRRVLAAKRLLKVKNALLKFLRG